MYTEGLEYNLLRVVLQKMNMTFFHVPIPEGFEIGNDLVYNLTMTMITKDVYIALGGVGTHYSFISHIDCTNAYYMTSIRCMYLVLSNILDGAASLEYSLGKCS